MVQSTDRGELEDQEEGIAGDDARCIVGLEPCPPELAHEDFPRYGGNLFFNPGTGLAGCVKCGWRGIATAVRGVISTRCPACAPLDYSVTTRHSRSISRSQKKRHNAQRNKASKKARKRNRR